jgi:anti-sigma-K factor RskA
MMTHEETVEILATYALDAVDVDEREAIEEHLVDCPRCRGELAGFREVATALGNSVEPLPEGLWSSIASRLPERHDEERPPMPRLVRSADADDDPEATSHQPVFRPMAARGRMATIASIVVAAAAVVAVLSVSLVHANDQVTQLQKTANEAAPSAVVSALETPGHKVVNLEGASHTRLAQFVLADGRGYLVSSTLPVLTGDQTYQLWGIVDGQPISLGLLGSSPSQSTFTLASSEVASKLAVTVEPAGGAVVPSKFMVAQGPV